MTNFIQYNGRMTPVKDVIRLKAEEKVKAEIKEKAKTTTKVTTEVTASKQAK